MTVKEASAAVGMNYDSLAELLRKYPSVRLWLGAWREKGAWVYLDTTLPKFKWIAGKHTEGWTLASIAKGVEQIGNEQSQNEQLAILSASEQMPAPIAQTIQVNEQTLQTIGQMLVDTMLQANDAFLTLKEAREAYRIPLKDLRALSGLVGRRRMVRRSDCLRWLKEWKP